MTDRSDKDNILQPRCKKVMKHMSFATHMSSCSEILIASAIIDIVSLFFELWEAEASCYANKFS